MKSLFFLLFCTLFLNASTLSLDEILQKLRSEHPLAKSIQASQFANSSQVKALSSREATKLLADTTFAKPQIESSGYEYSIGLEQNFMNPNVKNSIVKSAAYQGEAEILNLKHEFMLLENEVRLLYHVNCLDKESLEQYKRSFETFLELYKKKEKAYTFGEISKKELLQLQLELDRLKTEYKHYEDEIEVSRAALQSFVLLPLFSDKQLYCQDVQQVTKELLFNNQEESLKEESLNKKVQSLQSDFDRYSSQFDSFTLSAAYQNEIDADRFVVGLSVPLNFTSSLNEESRAMLMHKKSAIMHEKEGVKLQKASQADMLQNQLLQHFKKIHATTDMLNKYENTLMPLIENTYTLGESSAIEYLLSGREIWKLKEELIEQRKNYYKTLFQLYGVLKIKEQI